MKTRLVIAFLGIFLAPCLDAAQSSNQPQKFADKSYYLIDSLILEELSTKDSLLLHTSLAIYHSSEPDTSKYNAIADLTGKLYHICWQRYNSLLYDICLKQLETNNLKNDELQLFKKHLSSSTNNKGYIATDQGNLALALELYYECLALDQESGNLKDQSHSHRTIAYTLYNMGRIEDALEHRFKSLRLSEEINDSSGIAYNFNALGFTYQNQGMPDEAIQYYEKSLAIRLAKEEHEQAANTYVNIGNLLSENESTEEALTNFENALSIYKMIGHDGGQAYVYANLGNFYLNQDSFKLALANYEKALDIRSQLEDASARSASLYQVGEALFHLNQLDNAEKFVNDGLKLAIKIGVVKNIVVSSAMLSKIYKKQGNYQQALVNYELHIQMRDSVKNEETQKAAIRQQTKYEFEKKQLIKEQEEKDRIRLEMEATSRRDNLQYSVIFIVILFLFSGILFLGFMNVSERMAEGIIFFSFLIFFEFILVLADPYIETISGGAPGIKLLFNAGIAALIFPLHSLFEDKLKRKLAAKR